MGREPKNRYSTGNTNSPSIIAAPGQWSGEDSMGVGMQIFGSDRKKKPAKKFILVKMHESLLPPRGG